MESLYRFYTGGPALREGVLQLPPEESQHALRALRLREGDALELFDGDGGVGRGHIVAIADGLVSVAVDEVRKVEPTRPEIIVATAIPKGKRWQTLVEKCTELDVGEIQPVLFRRSVAEGQGDPAKWRRWAIEACKQCGAARVPVIRQPVPLRSFINEHIIEGPCLLAAPDGDKLIKWGGQFDRAQEVAIVIGPEGGLTEEEVKACYEASYAPVTLGPNILRVETAALAFCTLVRGLC